MKSLPLPLLGAIALVACGDPYANTDETTDTDVTDDGVFVDEDGDGISDVAVPVSLCTETYKIPGPFGTFLDGAVDPHAEVFGASQDVREGVPEAGQVSPEPSHVHLGWPGEDTSNSVSFVWSTDTGTKASQVQIGEGAELAAGDLTTTLDGVSYAYGGASGAAYRIHELKLCGRLKPATSYTYRVGGEGHWSATHTFTTPGAPGSFEAFTAIILGDSRGAYEEWSQILEAAEAHSPDLYLFSGDAVELGSNQFEWHAWWEASNDLFAERFFVPAHGNHEALATNYFAMFSLPADEQWFTLNYGPMSLASLNDTVPLYPAQLQFDQVTFLEEHLDTDAKWQLAMHHRPTYSACSRHGSDEELRGYWEPTFEELGVDVVLSGHNHIYERSVAIAGGESKPLGQGTLYLVSGGAGADLYNEVEGQWFNEVANPILHYIVADFTAEGAQFTVKALNGDEVDAFYVPAE